MLLLLLLLLLLHPQQHLENHWFWVINSSVIRIEDSNSKKRYLWVFECGYLWGLPGAWIHRNKVLSHDILTWGKNKIISDLPVVANGEILSNYQMALRGSHKVEGKMCVCVYMLVTQSCLILCDPIDRSLPGSSVHRILQARILEWVAIPFSRGSSWPKDWTQVCTAGRFFTIWATREVPEAKDRISQDPQPPELCNYQKFSFAYSIWKRMNHLGNYMYWMWTHPQYCATI